MTTKTTDTGATISSYAGTQEWGVRWAEFNRRGEKVTKEKVFPSEAALAKFTAKLEGKDTFSNFEAWFNA